MISLVSQPNLFCPNPKSHPIKWELSTDEHIDTLGTQALFSVTFTSTGSSDGDPFVMLGADFQVDDSTPYTSTTFAFTGSAQQAADNFLNMLQSNYLFNDWYLYISSSGGSSYTVNAFRLDFEQVPDFTFDYSDLTTSVAHSETNGQATTLKTYVIWYQVWSLGASLTPQLFTGVPFDDLNPFLSVPIDVKKIVRSFVSSTFPLWTLQAPLIDSNFSKSIYLRYGGIEKSDLGNNINTQTYESSEVTLVNSVFQIRESNAFLNHCPNGTSSPVGWLTDRPQNTPVALDSYEWALVWVENNFIFEYTTDGFKVVYEFDFGDGVTQVNDILFDTDTGGRGVIIPIGTACPFIAPYMGSCKKFTVKIQGKYLAGTIQKWKDYSETLTRWVKPGFCCEEEVYFIEDKGSWGTICFKEVTEVQLVQEGVIIETAHTYGVGIEESGGKSSKVSNAQKKCFLISEKLGSCEGIAAYYEQCLRSPEHWIRTTKDAASEGIQTRRRIVVDRQSSRLYKKGEKTQIILAYQFTSDLKLQ